MRGEEPCRAGIEDVHYSRLQRRFHDGATKSEGVRLLGKGRYEHLLARRQWKRAEVQACHNSESSERADQKLVQVVASDILHHAPAAFRNDAFTGDELDPQQEIPRRAVSVA